jgi:hypothetical protein
MSLQAAGFDRLRQASNRGFERTLRISSLDIGTIQDVLTTFVRFRDQSRQRENKSEKCDYFDCHLRPPPFDPMGLNTPKLLKSGSRATPKLNERISESSTMKPRLWLSPLGRELPRAMIVACDDALGAPTACAKLLAGRQAVAPAFHRVR